MRKFLSIMLVLMLSMTLVLTGCSGDEDDGFSSSSGGGIVSSDVAKNGSNTSGGKAEKINKAALSLDYSKLSAKAKIDVELADSLVQFIEENGGDLYGVKKVAADLEIGLNKNVVSADLSAVVNDVDIASVNAVVDLTAGDVYISAPEVSNTAIKVGSMDGVSEEQLSIIYKTQDSLMEFVKLFYSYDFAGLIKEYGSVAASQIGSAEEHYTDELFAGSISKVVDADCYTISAEEVYNAITAVAEKAKEDKKIKKLVVDAVDKLFDVALSTGEVSKEELEQFDGEDLYSEVIVPAIDDFLYDFNEDYEYVDPDEEMLTVAIFESEGEFAGFEIKSDSMDDDYSALHLYIVSDGDKFAFEFGSADAAVVADGAIKKGMFTGVVKLVNEGISAFELDVENVDCELLAGGVFDGTIIFSEELIEEMSDGEIKDVKLVLAFEEDVLTTSVAASLYYMDDLMVTASAVVKLSDNGSPVSVPKKFVDVEDSDSYEEWMSTVSLSEIISNLEQAGISTAVITLLQDVM